MKFKVLSLVFILVAMVSCGDPAQSLQGTWYGKENTYNLIILKFNADKTFSLQERGIDTKHWGTPEMDDLNLLYQEIKDADPFFTGTYTVKGGAGAGTAYVVGGSNVEIGYESLDSKNRKFTVSVNGHTFSCILARISQAP